VTAMYSPSVEESAMDGCFHDDQEMMLPARVNVYPVMDRQSVWSLTQSESL
jgi:hypothetical protein